jgi:hypothetical protein
LISINELDQVGECNDAASTWGFLQRREKLLSTVLPYDNIVVYFVDFHNHPFFMKIQGLCAVVNAVANWLDPAGFKAVVICSGSYTDFPDR